MLKFLDTKSLQFKMWLYFTFFSVFIFVMLWLFQIIFLNTYYESMKISEIRNITKEITAYTDDVDFEEQIYKTAFNNGVIVQLYNALGQPLAEDNNPAARRFFHAESNEVREFLRTLDAKKEGEIVSFIQDNKRPNMHFVIAGTRFHHGKNKVYLTLYAPLAPITATTEVLKNQLLLVTGILFVLSFVLSYFIAKRISRPLLKITDTASNLAGGDYEVRFEKGSYSEINRLADTLNFATSELSKTDALRRDLIANVSHDLRTPLTIIKSYSEMIRDFSGENAEKRNEHTKVIIDEADKMSTLVNDILDLSKAESGITELTKTRFDLYETIKSAINRFSVLTENDGYRFIFNSDAGFYVYADEPKISQTVYNLLSNAVNYTGDDKKIMINLSKNNGKIRFSVTDTGQGIAENELPKVWDRYYRSAYGRTRSAAGTGIGLSIVKNLLSAHNCSFGAESKLGEGSTFWFELSEVKSE